MPIYQLKDKKKWTKDGRSWYFRSYYTDIRGNKKQKESKLFKTKFEAKEAEIEFLSKIKNSDNIDKSVMFDTVYKEWLELKRHTIKSSTFYGLKHRTDKYILNNFMFIKLHSIKLNIINDWINSLNENNVSLEYINTIITYLKEILIYAKDNYDFDNKIVSKIYKYKIEKVSCSKKDSETNFWTYEEFNQFISNVDDQYHRLIFRFLYYTGCRKGEMIALTWNDIDFDNKRLTINKTFCNKVEGCTYMITDPKTKNSVRTIDIDDELIELLYQHYQEESKIYNFSLNMFIFGNIKYLSPTTLARWLDKYITKANVKKITPHGFRHSHVSLLINLGCDSRDVAERIGDTIRLVEETYYHMFPSKRSQTVNAINNLCIKTRGN